MRCTRGGRRGRWRGLQGYERPIQVHAAHRGVSRERVQCAVGYVGNPRVERSQACPAAPTDAPDDLCAVAGAVVQPDDDASVRITATRRTRLQRTIEFGAALCRR
jgi:hypothetical protein